MRLLQENNKKKKGAAFLLCKSKLGVWLTASFFVLNSLLSAQQINPAKNGSQKAENASSDFSFKILVLPDKTFGYDIYQKQKLIIHQNSIPTLPGTKGFDNSAAAQRVARLVVYKLRNGEMPPSLTTEDLKKLKAI